MTVSTLHPPARGLDAAALADIASGLARATSLWQPHARSDAGQRRSVRLLATASYEVWVLSWAPGQSVTLHDHGPSAGALVVLAGELTEVTVDGGALVSEILPVGTVQALDVGLVHDVLNEGPGDAVSLHVYSPPLSVMGVWDAETLTRVGLEVVEPTDAVHTEAA